MNPVASLVRSWHRFVGAGVLSFASLLHAAAPWTSDQGDGTYRNPVLFQDIPDPDAIRVGDDFFLVCSTFANAPGLTILQSTDLINWRYLTHVFQRQVPDGHFSTPRRGQGVWAPSLRHHDGRFWIYYPDPDFGIYVTTATSAAGPWSDPVLVLPGKGLIDPCPFWEDDGRLFLIHGWAASRGPVANRLSLVALSADGTRPVGESTVIIDGNQLPGYRTLEGPKLYKRGAYYYVFAPAGGVKTGWQSVFRSKSLAGPYEDRIVLDQGKTAINGPHQGAWVQTAAGVDWFLHFQDREELGRVLWLEPMTWRDDGWPVMGEDPDGDGRGQPVLRHAKPVVNVPSAMRAPLSSDEFSDPTLGLQWQWEANPPANTHDLTARPGWLRLRALPATSAYDAAHVLAQRLIGPASTITTALDLTLLEKGAQAGLVVMGLSYAHVVVQRTDDGLRLVYSSAQDVPKNGVNETHVPGPRLATPRVQLRARFVEGDTTQLSYSVDDGKTFVPIGPAFLPKPGRWVGTRVGLVALGASGAVDVDWFRLESLAR